MLVEASISKGEFDIIELLGHTTCYTDPEFWFDTLQYGRRVWTYIRNGSISHRLSREELDMCLDKKFRSQFVMTGDVNMEKNFFYLASGTGNMKKQTIHLRETLIEERMYQIGGTVFTIGHLVLRLSIDILDGFLITLPLILSKCIRRIDSWNMYMGCDENEIEPDFLPENDKAMMLIDAGLWDLSVDDAALFMAKFFLVLQHIEKMKKKNIYQMYWQNLPPWPGNLEFEDGMHTNTFIIAAVNAWVALEMRILNITVIDFWKIALPFEDEENPCGFNYLCKKDTYWNRTCWY